MLAISEVKNVMPEAHVHHDDHHGHDKEGGHHG